MLELKPLGIEEFRAILKKKDLKATPQRIAVHEAMLELGHASADMVAAAISEKGSAKVTVASVYNILFQMSSIGVYRQRMSRTSKMFFDVTPMPHAHVYDCESNTYRDLIDEELNDILQEYLGHRKFKGYKVEGIDVQLLVRPTKKRRTLTAPQSGR
ncbi:MAG: transcriptional repressor [Bacteroidales bacterium]|nr:transcriptional repressor [Bacteroidales bacterium]